MDEANLNAFLESIFQQYKYDFREYSRASMKRRVLQAVSFLKFNSLSDLRDAVLSDAKLFTKLLQFLTVGVSEMFRDPTYFKTIREQVVPVLMTYPSLKIWIAGCSTGQEVYSMAILLKEEGLLERTIIYATDINSVSLDKARAGIFPLDEIKGYTTNYYKSGGTRDFSNYYTAAFDSAIFDKSLRKQITFTDHSLSTDSVFSETHFVSCRNVFIYFDRNLQNRAVGLFHESLCRKGFLGLGPKETIEFTPYASSFDVVEKKDRLYRKNEKPPLEFNP